MKLSIVSPEETLYEGEVKSVKMQGIDGKFQVLNNHAPLISALGKGDIVIEEISGEEKSFAINSGLFELAKNEIHILATYVEQIEIKNLHKDIHSIWIECLFFFLHLNNILYRNTLRYVCIQTFFHNVGKLLLSYIVL